jgi:predicted transcriptional regulator YdeE
MPKIHIDRSIEIKASSQDIFDSLVDFKQWTKWSPWLLMEQGVQIDYAADGQSYEWKGSRIGQGRMRLEHSLPPHEISYDLQFLKPYKSKSKVFFQIEEGIDECHVTWGMDTSLPFYMGWMKKSLTANLQADYQRGLFMLKDYLEKGEAATVLHEEGVVDFRGCQYVGTTSECTVDEMVSVMSEDMRDLSFWVDNEELDIVGEPMTIYHKVDRIKNECAFTVAVPVYEAPDDLPAPFHSGKIPPLKALKIVHEGPYHHLANAWSLCSMMIQNKEIKPIKGFPPFEVYLNDPQDTADELLETAIYYPVKA